MRGGINPGDISMFVPGLSELYISEWIMILGMDPIVPRLRLLYIRSPINEQPAIRQKGHTRNFMSTFSSKTEPEILECQILCSVLSRTTNIPSTRREWSTATNSSTIIIAFEELNDEGSDTVFHA